jgi:hypothetical protein
MEVARCVRGGQRGRLSPTTRWGGNCDLNFKDPIYPNSLNGLVCFYRAVQGGKPDDITVVVARVTALSPTNVGAFQTATQVDPYPSEALLKLRLDFKDPTELRLNFKTPVEQHTFTTSGTGTLMSQHQLHHVDESTPTAPHCL